LLIAAALAFSIAAVLGSSPASAETFFAEGVWNADRNQFEFYDSRLNSSNPSTPYFASFGDDWYDMRLQTSIDFYNPFVFNSDVNYEKYGFGFGFGFGVLGDVISGFYNGVYRDVFREGDSMERTVYGFYWSCGYDPYYRCTTPQYGYTEKDGVRTYIDWWLALSEIGDPVSHGVGIFDFEQSFVYYKRNDGSSESKSLAQIIRNHDYSSYYYDTSNGSFSIMLNGYWSHGEITGITLAYNLPVPEPETWAMLLAGLGIVGAVSRRQRTKA